MLELLLKLLDKLKELAEISSDRKKRAFKEIAEPMFDELLKVHENYLLIFDEAVALAKRNPNNPSQAIEYLEQKRKDFAPVRVRLTALSNTVLRDPGGSSISEFVYAVAIYFPAGDIVAASGSASTSLITELKRCFAADHEIEGRDEYLQMMAISSFRNIIVSREQVRMSSTLAMQMHKCTSSIDLIESFIALQQTKWKSVCEAFAKVKAADVLG